MPDKQSDQRCPQCGETMAFRLGAFECAACGYTAESEQPRQAAPDYSLPQPSHSSQVPPPPPPGSSFYQHSGLQHGSAAGSQAGPSRLDKEKRGFLAGQAALITNFLVFTIMELNNPFAKMLGADPAAQAGMDHASFSMLLFWFFAVQIGGLIGAGVLLHINEAWAKWFGALGSVLAIGVILMSLGSRGIAVIGGDFLIVMVVLEVIIMLWLFTIFTRELRQSQPAARSNQEE